VVAGLASAGVDVEFVEVLPTPAIAHLVNAWNADLGVMLSASHNPMPDNGIKFFSAGGHKLDDEIENAIEDRMREPWDRPTGADVGRIRIDAGAGAGSYVDYLMTTLPNRLDGLKVVVDCANGAASSVGPSALRASGAEVIVIHNRPDGLNINDNCGSTHLGSLREEVVARRADAGVAYDGDADRCLAVDATGAVVDGDQIMGILAGALHERGQLADQTLVTTVMSNLGLLRAMHAAGIATVQTAVGDRYVLEEMRRGGFNLGGEQSGHVLLTDHATTGDGLLTSLHLLARVAELGAPLRELASAIPRFPQVLINVSGVDKARAHSDAEVLDAVAAAEHRLGDAGRVLLRPSGTEQLVRVMVEAAEQSEADGVAHDLAAVVRDRLAV
jgi:phosphoglucosamine mutase